MEVYDTLQWCTPGCLQKTELGLQLGMDRLDNVMFSSPSPPRFQTHKHIKLFYVPGTSHLQMMHISILKEGLNGGRKKSDEILQHLCLEETTLKRGGISAVTQVALENTDRTLHY